MPVGHVKWFSPAKGYGFITKEEGGDLFVHYSGLAEGQDRRLFPGDKVDFEEVEGEKGRKAIAVKRLPRPEDGELAEPHPAAESTEESR